MKPVNIGICGLGTVGSGTLGVLRDNADVIAARAQARLQVIHVGARRDKPALDLSGIRISRDIFAVAHDPEVEILVELIGGTTVARELVEAAIVAGKATQEYHSRPIRPTSDRSIRPGGNVIA